MERTGRNTSAVALVLLVAACTSATTTTSTTAAPPTTVGLPSVEVPDGYELIDVSGDGFVVAVPSEWVVLKPSGESLDEILEEGLAGFEPETADFLRGALAESPRLSLFATGLEGDPIMTVIVNPRTQFETFGNMEEIGEAAFEDMGTFLGSEQIEVAGNDAILLIGELVSQDILITQNQYWILTEDTVFLVAFLSAEPGKHLSTAEVVMSTFTPTSNQDGGMVEDVFGGALLVRKGHGMGLDGPVDVVLFLHDDFLVRKAAGRVPAAAEELMRLVYSRDGVVAVQFFSKEMAALEFDVMFGDDEDMDDVDRGILPASVRVWTISESVGDEIATDYRNHEGVQKVTVPNP